MDVAGEPPRPRLGLPRVALLILSKGTIPLEAVWDRFLHTNGETLGSNATLLDPTVARLLRGNRPGDEPLHLPYQELFSVYVHGPVRWHLPEGSIFYGHAVPSHVAVSWGDFSLVDAERHLLATALADPRNMRFVLISDSCVPLVSPEAFYLQLMSEPLSRVFASAAGPNIVQTFRRAAAMSEYNVTNENWRKSGQWKTLSRHHADLVLRDRVIMEAFRKHCLPIPGSRFCVPDEHYIPTLIAMRGEEEYTSAVWGPTYTSWTGSQPHPNVHGADAAEPKRIRAMRGDDSCQPAPHASVQLGKFVDAYLYGTPTERDEVDGMRKKSFGELKELAASVGGDITEGSAATAAVDDMVSKLEDAHIAAALRASHFNSTSPKCMLLARKIAHSAANDWAKALENLWEKDEQGNVT